MAETLIFDRIEQFKPFLNDKGFFEIVVRNKKKRYKAFQRITLSTVSEKGQNQLLNNALNLLNKNNSLLTDSLKNITKIVNLQQLSVIMNGVNLCATCAGFAIMYAKLDKISGQISQLMSVVKQGHEVQTDYEFKKVLSEHSNMLDSRKRQKNYTEEQMRKLVDDEYNVLNMLIDVLTRNLTENSDDLVVSIFSLASMMAVSLQYFDELYYFNNREAIGDGEKWHSSHDNWMSVFEKLSSDEFVQLLQDHAIFDLGLSTKETDMYYINLRDQVMTMAEDIRDNQSIIETLDNQDLMSDLSEQIRQEVSDEIQKSLDETEGAKDDPEVVEAYQTAMKQVGLV